MTPWPEGVPRLGSVTGQWMEAKDLTMPPTLRSQWGQGLADMDLSSLSWIAVPPFTFGYHTGACRINGEVWAAERFKWAPWGVQRNACRADVSVVTDTRMGFEQNTIYWRLEVANLASESTRVALEQDLFAMVASSDVGWGWLYDTPWNNGNRYDGFATERLRSAITSAPDSQPQLVAPEPRTLRLGAPRTPFLVRDDESEPMITLDTEMPQHTSADTVVDLPPSVVAEVRDISYVVDATVCDVVAGLQHAPVEVLDVTTSIEVGSFRLVPGGRLDFAVRLGQPAQTGVILTHGHYPDSLQVRLADGVLLMSIGGEQVGSSAVLEAGRWHHVSIGVSTGSASMTIDGAEKVETAPWWESHRWLSTLEDGRLLVHDTRSAAAAGFAMSRAPDSLRPKGSGATAVWDLVLEPREAVSIVITCAFGEDLAAVRSQLADIAADLPRCFAAVEEGWSTRWSHMFTPGNPDFSGHVPTLVCSDPELERAYYMGVLNVLYMHNTAAREGERIFLTGGPRLGPTTTFFWDSSFWSRLYALLEPEGLRTWLIRALSSPYHACFAVDNRNDSPIGNEYSANDSALFRLVEHYVCATGDTEFLSAVAGGRTVIEHLTSMALRWRELATDATGGVLADFGGDPWFLLESVPNYVNAVTSFNAGYLWMTRAVADLKLSLGETAEAKAISAQADTLAAAVMDLYAGDGRWKIVHPGRTDVIGHCLDFQYVAGRLWMDLSSDQVREMVEFVETKLLCGELMVALAPDDPMAFPGDRADHGSSGAYCGWPGETAYGLTRLGRPDIAAALLRKTPRAASGALWGGALEWFQDGEAKRFRVHGEGLTFRDSIGGSATAEAILAGLFGYNPSFHTLLSDELPLEVGRPSTAAGIEATMTNVNHRGRQWSITLPQDGASRSG